jgi:ABC-type uncharacterized transport system permease subunit
LYDIIDIIVSVLASSLPLTAPILLAGLGELYSERSGVMNLGVEGIMSISALVAIMVTYQSGSYLLGFFAAIIIGLIFGVLHGFITVKIAVNQLIAGLLLYSLADYLAMFIYSIVVKTYVPLVRPLPNIKVPLLGDIPLVGTILFNQPAYVYLSLIMVPLMGFFLYRTSWGLAIRSAGENPEATAASGINVNLVRFACVLLGSALAGLAGATISIGYVGIYQKGIIAGRGWLAIIAVILGAWNPYWLVLSSWVLGTGYALAATLLTIMGGLAHYYFYLMIPYITGLIVVLFSSKRTRGPAALTVPYKRK